MVEVTIYTKNNCIYCQWAKKLLDQKGMKYNEINVEVAADPKKALDAMLKEGKGKTFPQIILDGEAIGGYDDLSKLLSE